MSGILYQEIAKQLQEDLIKGKYPLHSLLPSENELVEMLSVSKITVRKAVERLVSEGYLLKQRGIGTTVISNRPFNILNNAIPFTRILEKRDVQVESKILESGEYRSNSFSLPYTYEVKRVYHIEGTPAIYAIHRFSLNEKVDLTSVLTEDFSLYRFLYGKTSEITRITDKFKPIHVNEELSQILHFQTDLALERNRFSYG
ncbi:MAG: GntR family transcriptional regulator, partial [Streptococcaceae bacterium]|nr:GntR family transcriptional regulator [Streptococcaceae bacterium]